MLRMEKSSRTIGKHGHAYQHRCRKIRISGSVGLHQAISQISRKIATRIQETITITTIRPAKNKSRSAQFIVVWGSTLRYMNTLKLVTIFEISGSALAIVYALLIASNTGYELLGFSLLLISSGLFAAWALIDRRWAFLSLQFFYAASALIGLVRWSV